MAVKFAHVNIIARDWKSLVKFYVDVCGCVPVPPERDLKGEWLDEGTGVTGAHITGMHLRLPGHGETGPTLEIFHYDHVIEQTFRPANQQGLRHLAFVCDDVEATLHKALANGAGTIGKTVVHPVPGVGMLTFTYISDPEGNIIELQSWK